MWCRLGKSKTAVIVKGIAIGEGLPKVCIPIVGKTSAEILAEVKTAASLHPDLIEWRVDFFEDIEDINKVLSLTENLHHILPDIPIIFTCRVYEEGGYKKIDESYRFRLIEEVLKSNHVDIIDIELISGKPIIGSLIKLSKMHNVSIIVSNHDFQKTPDKEVIIERLMLAEQYGADIAKIAVMPTNEKDVLTLLDATLEVNKNSSIPLITMSMSGIGVVSRIAGGIFGSSLTFAAGKDKSAPGQIPIDILRESLKIVHDSR